jgi:sulfonate transport system permease protein
VLALVAGLSRLGEALIDGPVQMARSIPPLGLVPLMILWLGIGETFKIVIIAYVVFVPIYMNLYSGLSQIDSRYVELAETLQLSRWQFVRSVIFPGALPGLFLGLRLGATYAWMALVILEQINATSGLGYLMFQAQNYGQSDIILVGLTIYALLGLASDTFFRISERRILSWQRTLAS